MELEREACVHLTVAGIAALCVVATAVTAWWSAFCRRRLCQERTDAR